jgi:hypothetical protein
MCVFLLVVFAAPQQETTLASPRRTLRKPLPGPAALGSPSLRRPRKGRSVREKPNYRRNFTPPEIDAGFSHQPSDIPRFFEKMREGYDCVFGTRFAKGGRIEDSSFRRYLISWGGTLLSRLLLGTRLSDMTSGFELFRAPALASVVDLIHSRGPFFQPLPDRRSPHSLQIGQP